MSDLARLSEVVRLALTGPITVTPDGTVFRVTSVDGADEEVPLTKAQKAALRRALDPRREGIVVTIHPHPLHGPTVEDARGQGYAAGYEAGLSAGRRRPPGY